MEDFSVDLPPVPAFKPQLQNVIYRSKMSVEESGMDHDQLKKHLRSFTKKQRFFTSVSDVRQSIRLSALSKHKQKLVANNKFSSVAAHEANTLSIERSFTNAATISGLRLDEQKYIEAVERLKNSMNEKADNEQYEMVRFSFNC